MITPIHSTDLSYPFRNLAGKQSGIKVFEDCFIWLCRSIT